MGVDNPNQMNIAAFQMDHSPLIEVGQSFCFIFSILQLHYKTWIERRVQLVAIIAAGIAHHASPAHWRVARLPGLWVFPSARKHPLPPSKKPPEKRNLLSGWRGHCYAGGDLWRLFSRLICLRTFQRAQLLGDLRPFPVECGQPALQGRNLSSNVVCVGDRIVPFSRRNAPGSLSGFPWRAPHQF
jgi:hypothetical protein